MNRRLICTFCDKPAIVYHEGADQYFCKRHKAELDAEMKVVIDNLARKLAAMNDEELKAWMESDE